MSLSSTTSAQAGALDGAAMPLAGDASVTAPPADERAHVPASAKPSATRSGVTASSEIDRRRARQLLDRAFALYEEGAANDAILACRQAISLAPVSPQGYSLLGLMLERRRDTAGAIAAYEKVIALAPESALERDSLQRLRAANARTGKVSGHAAGFDFNEAELFGDLPAADAEAALAAPSVAPALAPGAATVIVPAATTATASSASVMPSAVAPGAPRGSPARPGARSLGNVPAADAFSMNAPVAPAASPASSVSPVFGGKSPFDAATDPFAPSGPAAGWQRLLARPSYFYQGLPLLMAALVSLLFLGWAQHRASVRHQVEAGTPATRVSALPDEAENTSLETPSAGSPSSISPSANAASANTPAGTQNNNPGSPFSIGNAPSRSSQSTPGAPGAQSSANGANGTASRPSIAPRRARSWDGSPRPRSENRIPPFPVPLMPSPATGVSSAGAPGLVAPASPRTGAPAFPAMPPMMSSPRLQPRSSQPVQGLPVEDEGAPGPSPAANGGIIRIAPQNPSPASAPARASARAREAEQQASRAARSGDSATALNQLNEALRSGGGTGWNYQQKGLVQLQDGEYERAIDSFRTAIQGYSEQIARGENAAEARAGIQTCRSGIRMAQAQLR
jgi:tetratricopeptide (TPR) repeat protein